MLGSDPASRRGMSVKSFMVHVESNLRGCLWCTMICELRTNRSSRTREIKIGSAGDIGSPDLDIGFAVRREMS